MVTALAAVQPQEAMCQDAAFEEGVGLILDESRQLGSDVGLGVGDEADCVLLHQTVPAWSARDEWRSLVDRGSPSGALWALGRRLARGAPEVVS